jgi:hypothetical protein
MNNADLASAIFDLTAQSLKKVAFWHPSTGTPARVTAGCLAIYGCTANL